jgi:hypothetical protein
LTFDKKLTIAVLLGTLPLAAVSILCGLMIAAARRYGGGADVIMLTLLCTVSYAFACLVLLPSIAVVIDRTWRRKLPLTRRPKILTAFSITVIALPVVAVNALFYLLAP